MQQHGTKTTPVFLPADGEAPQPLLPSSVLLLSGGTLQPENTYCSILRVTGHFWESQKSISISTFYSYHQRSYPNASLHWSNDKARFIFSQSNSKRWGAKLVDVKYLPIRHFRCDRQGNYCKNLAIGVIPFFIVSVSSVGEKTSKAVPPHFFSGPRCLGTDDVIIYCHHENYFSKYAGIIFKTLWLQNTGETRYQVR